jgi:hypothetical protein
MSIAGLSSPAGYAPGPYGNSVTAKSTVVRTLRTDDQDAPSAEEAWRFEAESGDSIQLEWEFVRGIAVWSRLETTVHSAVHPEFYRIYRVEQAADVLRGTDGADRVQRYLFKFFRSFSTVRSSWSASPYCRGFRARRSSPVSGAK